MHWNLLPLAPLLCFAACANQQEETNTASTIWYACESGAAFTAERTGEAMAVDTGYGRYQLAPRSSSIGQKFASQDTTLIIDEDFAVLTGAPGNGYTNCNQVEGPVVNTNLQGI